MAGNSALWLAVVFVALPWVVILIDAIALGFNFALSLLMLVVFAIGLLFLAAAGVEG